MARYYGNVAYAKTVERAPGVYVEDTIPVKVRGDILRNINQVTVTENLNNDIRTNNQISIVAPPELLENYLNIRYVELAGVKWRVSSVDVLDRPRLLLSLGGRHNEATY